MRLSWREEGDRTALVVDASGDDGVAAEGDWAVLPDALVTAPAGAQSTVEPATPPQPVAWPSMAGQWSREGDGLRFDPRFPFLAGVTYAVLRDGRRVAALTRPARPHRATTRVVAIEPDVPQVPLNLLRVSVQFSAPMRDDCALRHVHATDAATGARRDGVFLDMTPQLWDASRTRLTLLLDPGRIKRGLVPHQESGYPLEEGRTCVVTIDAAWPDAQGQPLGEGAARSYVVGPAVRARVRPDWWVLDLPAAGTRDPLVVRFERPLDRVLVDGSLRALADHPGGESEPIPGAGEAQPDGRAWRFVPAQPWPGAPCRLRVRTRLEDLAGNAVSRVFDRDLTRREDDPVDAPWLDLPFAPRGDVG